MSKLLFTMVPKGENSNVRVGNVVNDKIHKINTKKETLDIETKEA